MEILITGFLAFVSTNLDDIFILTLFFGNNQYSTRQIVIGQFTGIGFLIAVSMLISLAGLFIDQAYIGLLGLMPIYLGVKGLLDLIRKKNDNDTEEIKESNYGNVLTVASVTVANGGDNIGIYVPLFAALTWANKISISIIFFFMTAVWCMLARYFTKHPYIAKLVDKYGHIVTPFVLIALGIFILHENGTFAMAVSLVG